MSHFHSNTLLGASGNQGYEIERSLRFNSGDSAHLTRTPSSASNSTTFTWSAWIKVDSASGNQTLFSATSSGTLQYDFLIVNNQLNVYGIETVFVYDKKLSRVFRDPSAWYHLVVAFDTTDSTPEDRIKIYVNGERETDFATNTNPSASRTTGFNKTVEHSIGGRTNYSTGQYFGGYQTEINFIDGSQLGPENFGETDSDTGAWVPKKYVGTYGTNGFYLDFSDNSNSTSTTLGKDSSGNGNNWAPSTNISVAAGPGNDSLEDTPTNNWCTLNPNDTDPARTSTVAISNGNLDASVSTYSTVQYVMRTATFASNGKDYFEVRKGDSVSKAVLMGFLEEDGPRSGSTAYAQAYVYSSGNNSTTNSGRVFNTTSATTGYPSTDPGSLGDVIMICHDRANKKIWFGKNGTWFTTGGVVGDPATGTAPAITYTTDKELLPCIAAASFANTTVRNVNFGQRPFDYTPPTGFEALNTANLPLPTVKDGTEYFKTVLYTGDDSVGRAITVQDAAGNGWQPDFVWVKARNQAYSHHVYDSVRGASKRLLTNGTQAEFDQGSSDGVSAFNPNGFDVSHTSSDAVNQLNTTYAAFNWKAGGSGSANTDGTISSTVSVNTEAGFSIGTFSGTGSAGTIGHGLGVAPKLILMKNRDSTTSWAVYHDAVGANQQLLLNSNNKASSDTNGFPSAPTSTVINVGSGSAMDTNQSGSHVFYAFAEVEGFSKFGSYESNNNVNGPFVYTGFRPAFIITKDIDRNSMTWILNDSARDPFNPAGENFAVSGTNTDPYNTNSDIDILSNGFKLRGGSSSFNNYLTETYIYIAFAENPFKYANAR